MNEHQGKSGGDISRDQTGLASHQTSRSSNESQTSNRIFEKNGWIHHVYDPKKMAMAIFILGLLGYCGSKFLGFLRGYNEVRASLHSEIYDAVPKTPYETRGGNTVTLYRQITNIDEAIVILQDKVKTIEDKKDFKEASEATPSPFDKKNKGRK